MLVTPDHSAPFRAAYKTSLAHVNPGSSSKPDSTDTSPGISSASQPRPPARHWASTKRVAD